MADVDESISFHGSSSDLEIVDRVLSDDCVIPEETPEMELDLDSDLISLGAFKRKKRNSDSDQEIISDKSSTRPRKTPNRRDSPKSSLSMYNASDANYSQLPESASYSASSCKKDKNSSIGNHTLKSLPGKTFLLRPIDSEASPNFTKNPVKLAKSLKAHPFSSLDIKNVRTNQRRNLIAVEVNSVTDTLKSAVLQTKKFAGIEVTIYIPRSETHTMGVIGPIDPSVSMEELKDLLVSEGNVAIDGVARLNKFVNGQKMPSASVRVTFSAAALPRFVYVDFMRYRVREYKPGPLRCYNCQMFGHAAAGCNRPRVCLHCSGNHNVVDCPNSNARCANCKGEHKASSTDCPIYRKYSELVDKKQPHASDTIAQAHRPLQNLPMNALQVEIDVDRTHGLHLEASPSEASKSYAFATKENSNISESEDSINEDIISAISTMKDTILNAITDTLELKQNELHNVLIKKIDEQIYQNNLKVAKFIQDAFASFDINKKPNALTIKKMIKDHFGNSVSEKTDDLAISKTRSSRSKNKDKSKK